MGDVTCMPQYVAGSCPSGRMLPHAATGRPVGAGGVPVGVSEGVGVGEGVGDEVLESSPNEWLVGSDPTLSVSSPRDHQVNAPATSITTAPTDRATRRFKDLSLRSVGRGLTVRDCVSASTVQGRRSTPGA